MNRDLEQAKAALEAGRRDEALVYAWNALSSAEPDELVELRTLAEELGDASLRRELDTRGVPAGRPATPAPDKAAERSRAQLIGKLVFAAITIALLGLFVSQIPTEPGPVRATRKDTVVFTKPAPIVTVSSGVFLVPLGDVRRVDVHALAAEVGRRYRVPASTLAPLPLPLWTLDPQEHALNGDQLIHLLQMTYSTRGRAAVIGITDYDMFSPNLGLHGLFSLRNPGPYGVVSSSTLGASLFDRIRGHDRHERVRKLVARNIGFLYLGRPESSDPHSLLRSSMSSVHDIDALKEDL
jgi:hypothetical protein